MSDGGASAFDPTRCWLLESARRYPRETAVTAGGAHVDFTTLADGARGCAARLTAAGVGRADRVALLLGADVRFVELLHALQMIGAVAVPLSDRLTLHELEGVIEHCEPKLIVYGRPHGSTAARLAVGAMDAAGELDALPATVEVPERVDPAALHSIVYTSGSSGRPKGVMLTNANHLAASMGAASRLGLVQEDRWLAPMPMYHVGGMSILLRSAVVGLSVVLHERFDADAVWRAIEAERVTIVSVVPTMLVRMMEATREPPASLRAILVGGASLQPAVAERASAIGLPVRATYGLTEAASQVATAEAADLAAAPTSCGRPIDGIEVCIEAPDDSGFGEICIRGDAVTPGYFRDRDAIAAALRDGWWATGDLGRLDGSGRLEVAGRRTDLIVTGGENVAPAEVEAVLEGHRGVAGAAVYGDDDAQWGQRVVARVVLRAGEAVDAADLEAWCRERLAGFKVPRRFEFCDALPLTPSGKVSRARLGRHGSGDRTPGR